MKTLSVPIRSIGGDNKP